MGQKLISLLASAHGLTIKIRFTLDYLEEYYQDGNTHRDEALIKIKVWEKQLAELNEKIIFILKSEFSEF